MEKAEMEKTRKKFFQIDLNWYGENHRFYRWSNEEDFVLTIAIFALAKKLNLHWRVVESYIRDGFDRYLVRR